MNPVPLFRLSTTRLMICGCLCAPLTVHAADSYKADNSDNLNLPSSWDAGSVPTSVDVANWDSFVTAANSTLLGADMAWDGMRVFNPAGPVTISGPNLLSLGASGIDLTTATQDLRLNNPVALTADQLWRSASGRTITGAGAITGAFNLTKTGAGSLVLEGPVSNNAGNLTIDTSGGAAATSTIFLGKTGGAVAVGAGKTVQFGTGTTGQMNLRMLQPQQFSPGVVMNFGNASGNWCRFDLNGYNQTFAGINGGLLATASGGVIQNRLVSENLAQLGPVTLTLDGSGTYLYNGILRDVDGGTVGNNLLSVVKNGSGTQTFAGNGMIYTGGTIVNDGKIILGPMVTAGSGTIRGAVTVNAPGSIDYAGDNSFGYNAGVNVNSLTLNGATLGGANFGNHFYQSFALNMTGASVLLGGTLNEFHNSTITVNSSATTSTIARAAGNTTAVIRVRDTLPMTINVADGSQPVDLLITAPLTVQNAGSIVTKSGAGTLSLSGAQDNSSNALAVTGGTVLLDKSAANMRAVSGITNIGTGATVRLIGTGGDQIYGGAATGTSGRVNMGGGTLDLAGISEGWDRLEGTGTITNSVATPAILTLGQTSGTGAFAGSINDGAGTIKLVKVGTGTLGLSGSHTLSGAVEVNAGTLALSGSIPSSAATVADGAGLTGEGSVAALTLGATTGASLSANPATPGAFTVAGALEVKGTTAVSLASASFTPGVPFKVISFGSKAGIWNNSNFALATPANYRGTPTFTENANDVSLTLTGANLTWNNAAADLKWNTNLSANFHDGTGNSTFFWGDKVTFGDGPGASQAIVIDGAQHPASMTVNSQYDYTFTSGTAGSLGGGMSLVKSGTGTLSMATTNTFLGSTTVNGGTLTITSDASLGTAPLAPTPGHLAIDGGTLRWNANFNINGNRGIALGAGGATVNTTAAGNGNTVTIASAIAGNGALTLLSNGDNSDTGGGVGGYTVLSSADNNFTGNTTITSGVVGIQSNFGNAANIILLNGAGLVDPNLNINFTRNIQIGALGGNYRSFGGVATGALAGSISNAPGVPTTTLRHTDGGTVSLTGDGSGFTGQYQNKRGNTRILSANWANTDFIEDTAGGWLEFRTGGASTVNSVASTRDVFVNNGTTLNVDTGVISMATNAHWWQTNLGAQGMLTSSTGTLTLTNGAASGSLGTLDQQMRLRLVDFNGSTPLSLVKSGVNQLNLNQANTHSGGTTINGGRIHTDHLQCFGTGPVTVNNGGQVFLTTAGTYTNNFTITGTGQLEPTGNLGAIRFGGHVISGSVTVAPAGARLATHNSTGTLTGALLGSGNLEINTTVSNTSSTISLLGNNSGYTGIATVAQGRLNLGSTPFGGSLVVSDGKTLAGEPTVAGTIALGSASGSSLVIDAGTPAMLTSTGAMTVTGMTTVTPTGVIPSGTPVKVVGFGSKGGVWNETNFQLSGVASYRPGVAFAEVGNSIELTVPTADLTWNNSVANSTWNTNVDANFQDSVPTNQAFFWGDRVTFGDLPGVAQAITVSGTVQPSLMTVNSQYDHSFTGGTIGGGTIVKSGTGILTLSSAVAVTNGLQVNQGEARLVNANFAAPATVASGATLNLANAGNTSLGAAAAFTLSNGATLAHTGTGYETLAGALTTSGTTSIAVTNTGSSNQLFFDAGLNGSGTLNVTNTGSATTGVAFRNLAGSFAGTVNVNGGQIAVGNSANGVLANATLNLNSTATLHLGAAAFGITATGATVKSLNGSGTVSSAGSTTTLTLGSNNGSGTFSGPLTNGFNGMLSLSKTGAGAQVLTGASTYGGTTTVDGGSLLANNSTGSGTGTSAVTVNATGTLGGTGAVSGTVTVNSGGTLAPGASIESLATGGLTLAAGSNFAVEFDSSGVPTADVVNVTGNVSLAGGLNLSDLAGVPTAIALGTKLTILTYTGTLTGSFAGVAEGTTVSSGPNTFLVRYADSNAVTLEATNFVGTPYDTWASSKGLTGANNGPGMDPDNDGISNLLEFYLDGNPLAADGAIIPAATLNATHLVVTFKRRDDAEAHIGTELVQRGSSLATWTDIVLGATSSGPDVNGVLVQITENGASPDTITVSIPRSLEVGAKLFARLKVLE